jgi:hypothetical protein
MINQKKFLGISLSFLVLFTSCKSAVIATHEDVMAMYTTEKQVVDKFDYLTAKRNQME